MTVTVTNGCGNNTYGSSEVALEVATLQKDQINVYPNPACNVINIVGIKPDHTKLFNMQGQWIKTYTDGSTTIDISTLPSGIYYLHFTTKVGVWVHKLVKD